MALLEREEIDRITDAGKDDREIERKEAAKLDFLDSEYLRIEANVQMLEDAKVDIGITARYLKTEDIDMFLEYKPPEDVNPKTVSLAIARGAITGTSTLAVLPLIAVDYLAFGITKIFDEDAAKESFDSSGKVARGAAELGKLFDPNFSFETGKTEVRSAFANRAAEKIGEFVAPGGFLVKGMSAKGARFLAKNPEAAGWWQKLFIEVAKDPLKAQAIEAGLNTVSAVAGEAGATGVIESGGTQENAGYTRFAAEMGSIVGITMATRTTQRVVDFFQNTLTLTETSRRVAAERNMALLLNELFEADPKILENLAKAEKLEAQTGIKFNLAEASQNPDIQATFNAILATAADPANTRFVRTLEADRKRIKEYLDGIRPILQTTGKDLKTELKKFVDSKFDDLDKIVARTEERAIEEAMALHPNRTTVEIGEAAEKQLNSLEDGMDKRIGIMYDGLGPDIEFKTNILQSHMLLARLSGNMDDATRDAKRLLTGKEPAGLKGQPTNYGKISQDIIDAYDLNFKDVATVNMQKLRDFRKMVGQEERIQRSRGDIDTANRLDILRKGIDKQFAAPTKRSVAGNAATLLKEANAQWTKKHERFTKAYQRVGIQRDLNGMFNFSPEDFGRIFLRTNTRKGAIESANRFKQIFGTNKDGKVSTFAKAIIRDTVRNELSSLVKLPNGAVNPAAVANWIKNRKLSLKAHGLWDEFKDVGSSARKAEEAVTNITVDRKLYNQSMLSMIIKSTDTHGTIKKMLDDGSITLLREELRRIKNSPAERALAQELWDVVVGKSNTRKLDTAENLVRKPDELLITLQESEKELRKGLGNGHYNNLIIIARIIKRKEGVVDTAGPGLIKVSGGANTEEEIAKGTAKIYAAARGFISPQFVVGSLARQGMHIINSKAARNVIEEAMYDWRFAKELAERGKTIEGRKSMQYLRAAMIPISMDALNTDDERTEL